MCKFEHYLGNTTGRLLTELRQQLPRIRPTFPPTLPVEHVVKCQLHTVFIIISLFHFVLPLSCDWLVFSTQHPNLCLRTMSSTKPLTPLDHPTLHCALVGKEFDAVTQYRGLQYATIPARFQDSIPNDTLILNSIHNGTYIHSATTFGPSCPQKRGAQAWDLTLTGDDLHLEMEAGQGADEKMDERGCLTVNVSVPKGVERPENGFPVFVWVHGGGLAMGSNTWPQYDLRKFVERSVASGKPVISVAVNYRVGVLGFLACEELGARGNMGFKDIVLGLRWVRRHIAGFGGDAGNLTAAGESAGGIALSTVLCAETGPEPLFERVVVMSGETTLRKPRGGKWHQEMYEDQLKYLRLDEEKVGKEERVKRLREEDAEELCQKLPLAQHFCGFVDGEWLKKAVTPSALEDGTNEMHKPEWCKELVIGDTVHDVRLPLHPLDIQG
jgi:carboxylesterase type B